MLSKFSPAVFLSAVGFILSSGVVHSHEADECVPGVFGYFELRHDGKGNGSHGGTLVSLTEPKQIEIHIIESRKPTKNFDNYIVFTTRETHLPNDPLKRRWSLKNIKNQSMTRTAGWVGGYVYPSATLIGCIRVLD